MSTVVPVVAFAALAVSWLVADEAAAPQETLSKVRSSHFPISFHPGPLINSASTTWFVVDCHVFLRFCLFVLLLFSFCRDVKMLFF